MRFDWVLKIELEVGLEVGFGIVKLVRLEVEFPSLEFDFWYNFDFVFQLLEFEVSFWSYFEI
jgi:hypothetical protein